MGLFEHFPYVNFHEQNIDWVLKLLRTLDGDVDKLKKLMASIDASMEADVERKLNEWLKDGTLEDLINETALADINSKVEKLTDLSANKMLLIGDSYNYGNGGVSGHGWGYYVQQITGANCTVIHQNGGGFAVNGNSNASYPGQTYAGLVGLLDADAGYDIIVAQSGWNDASPSANPSGSAAIETGVHNFITAVRNKYPNAKLYILPCYNDTYPSNIQQVRLLTMARAAAAEHVPTCFSSLYWLQNSGYNSTDNIHLVDAGYRQLANMIVAYLLGWSGDVSFEKDITSSVTKVPVEGITLGGNVKVIATKDYCSIDGDITLTETLPNWTIVINGLPAPHFNQGTTSVQWASEFKRPLRMEVSPDKYLHIRYGEAGNYRLSIKYPINHTSE